MQVSRQSLRATIARLAKPGSYGLDTETTGLRFKDRLFCVILADGPEAFYFNYQWYEGLDPELVLPKESLKDLQEIFDNTASTFYISNAKFDLSMLRKEGLEVHGTVFCTNALGRIVRNNYFTGYSLAESAKRLGFEKDTAVEKYIAKNGLYTKEKIPGKKLLFRNADFTKVPYEIMSKYAEMDAKLHWEVGHHLETELARENSSGAPPLTRLTQNEIELTRVCFEMEWTGVKINRAYVKGALDYEENLKARAIGDFVKITGTPFVDSNKALSEVFTHHGEAFPTTEKGNPSFTDAVLESFNSPLAKAVQAIRTHEKRSGTYFASFLFHADDSGIVHPNMRQGGTETGRFSYSDPNLQNVPKEDEPEDKARPYLVRGSFVPRDDFCFVMIDYAQQEYRLMLDYANETALIREVMNGADVHQATADLLGVTRKQAKTLNFMILYGGGVEKLAAALNISDAEARTFRELYFAKLPRVENLIAQVSGKGRARGFVWNWAGRRSYIANSERAYTLPNHLIQGSGADVMKFAMVRLAKFLQGKKSRMILNVHDELLFEVHETELEVVADLKRIMEAVYEPRHGMYLTCSVDHSYQSWASTDKIAGVP